MLLACIRHRAKGEDCDVLFSGLRHTLGDAIAGSGLRVFCQPGTWEGLDVVCGFPVARPVQAGLVEMHLLAGGTVLAATHRGPDRGLAESWEVLYDYIEAENVDVAGARREVYLERDVSGREDHLTELQVPLRLPHGAAPRDAP